VNRYPTRNPLSSCAPAQPQSAFSTLARSLTRTGAKRACSERFGRWQGWLVVAAVMMWLAAATIPSPLRAAPLRQSSSDPLLFAFYYSWFDENSWSYDQLSDLPAERYVSRDRAVMGRHIDQAKAAGIDAFLLAWYGPGGGNQTEPNLAAMLEEASARNFKIGILFETNSPFMGSVEQVTSALQHIQTVHANHPAFLRVDGRPVLFFWRPTMYGVETWRNIRSQSDPNYSQIWISEGIDTSYLAIFDGHHLYSNTWNPPANLTNINKKFAGQVATARERYGAYKFWVATVMPGYNDVRIRRGSGFAKDREGGAYYAQSWQAAIAGEPNWIVINSFNEWPEGSYIEPSEAFGDQFIGLTAQYAQQYRAGGGISVPLHSAPNPLPLPEPTPEPEAPTAYVNVAMLNLRSGPDTSFPVVAQLTSGAAMNISGSHPRVPEWWQVRHGDTTAWVYAPMVRTGGPMEQVSILAEGELPAAIPPADTMAKESPVAGLESSTPIDATAATGAQDTVTAAVSQPAEAAQNNNAAARSAAGPADIAAIGLPIAPAGPQLAGAAALLPMTAPPLYSPQRDTLRPYLSR
jgi:hypothetical protein